MSATARDTTSRASLPLRAAIYSRTLASDQSCRDQEQELTTFCRGREWEPRPFRDDRSLLAGSRPGLALLLDAVRRRKVKAVVCAKLTDLAGSLAQFAVLYEEFKTHQVGLVCIDQDIDTVSETGRAPVAALRAIVSQTDAVRESAGIRPVSVTIPVLDNLSAGPSALAVTVMKHGAEETVLACGDRTYRVRGLARNSGYESLRISLRVTCGSAWHLDSLDLTQARQRAAFISAAAGGNRTLRLELLKRDVGRVLLKLEELHEERLLAQVAPGADHYDAGGARRRLRPSSIPTFGD